MHGRATPYHGTGVKTAHSSHILSPLGASHTSSSSCTAAWVKAMPMGVVLKPESVYEGAKGAAFEEEGRREGEVSMRGAVEVTRG